MNYFDYPLEVKNCGDDGTFWGYASVFDHMDLHKEVVSKGAFKNSLNKWKEVKKQPKMLWQHDPKIPIGVWEDIQEDHYGLLVKGRFLLDIQHGREAYSLLKSGIVDGLSIGFHAIKSRKNMVGRTIDEIDLHEISLVTFAANQKAKVEPFKNWSLPCTVIQRICERLGDLIGVLDQQPIFC